MIQRILILVFLITTNTLFSQVDTISISGMYYGTNVYVYNPSVADSFSIQKLIINKDTISEDLKTNGIEIDLGSYNFDEGSKINILVLYKSSFAHVIVNPEALMPPIKFRISKPVYTRNDELQWQVRGVPGDYPIIVEQYKWNKYQGL